MRVYLHPAISKLLSTVVLLLSLGVAAFLVVKAIQTVQADPSLNEIPEVLDKTNP